MSVTKTRMTIDDLMKIADRPGKRELVDGEIIEMGIAKPRQGRIVGNVFAELKQWAKTTGRGEVYVETGFQIGEDLRVPDVAVVAVERIPEEGEPDQYWPFAPDVAVEGISLTHDYEAVLAKTKEYLQAGTPQVWLISPTAQTVTVYRSLTNVRVFGSDDELDGGEELIGFRCPVADLFAISGRSAPRSTPHDA